MSKLTDKQKLFAKEFLVDLNATQAAIRAGYSKKTARSIANENLTKPDIQEYIQSLMDKRAERVELTADQVLANLEEVRSRCMQHTPVLIKEGGEWVESGEYQFDSRGALKALELQGKHLKLFTDQVEQKHTGGYTVVFDIPRPEQPPKE